MKILPTATCILDRMLVFLGFSKDIQLAVYFGVSAQAISQARKKNKVPDAWLVRLAYDNVPIDIHLQAENVRGQRQKKDIHHDFVAKDRFSVLHSSDKHAVHTGMESSSFAEEFCIIPLVAAKLSAGGGSMEVESEVLHRLAFRRQWIARRGNPQNMVLMRVYGDSMEPYIQQGDLTLIDTSSKDIIPHAIFAVGVDDGIYIKILEPLPGQRLILRSFNERYSPIDIDMRGDLADSVRIIGKVLWWCHEA